MKRLLYPIILAIFFSACSSKTPYTNRSQMIFISQKEEFKLGEESYKKALSESEIVSSGAEFERVKRVATRIADATAMSEFKWEFNLVKDDLANAYCLPGGKIVVYTGILKYAHNDDQLATVISHEVAHALARHGAERMSQAMIQQSVGAVGDLALSIFSPQTRGVFNQVYGVGTNLGVMLPYGRMQESEADEIGIHLMHQAGYNIHEAVKFWENMSSGGGSKTPQFLSTHPSSSTRIEDIKKVINRIGQ
ncbi:MAG: M48 family metallopeptidase [Sulfuricurvum sp.]